MLIFVIVALLALPIAEGSGFMQWSRPMYTTSGTYANSFASVAGINVINYEAYSDSPTAVTDIVSSDTGNIILSLKQTRLYDANVIIVPAEDSKGLFTCQPLYTHEGEGDVATQPMWCGVLQFLERDASAGMQIILSNGTIVPLIVGDPLGLQLPWQCSNEYPCVARTQELRSEQLGGCQRRQNSSATQTGPNDLGPQPNSPPQSTHVTIAWNGTFYMFRPLVVAAAPTAAKALSLITKVASPVWTYPPERIDNVVQYVTIAYPLGPNKTAAANGPFVIQWAVCALAIINENGTIQLFDSDRDYVQQKGSLHWTGLMYFTTTDLPEPALHCTPFIETVLKLLPCFEPSRTVHAAVYSSTFALTCASGVGFLYDFVIQGPGQYPAPVHYIGKYEIPTAFNVSDLPGGTPVRTDISFVLVQPYVTVAYPNGTITRSFSQYFSYAVSIAISRIPRDEFIHHSREWSSPPFVTIVYTSVVSTSAEVCPWMTNQLIGQSTLHNFTTVLLGSEIQNVTNSIGWVSTAAIPADLFTSTSLEDPAPVIALSEADATARVARWVAADGLAYSIITEDLFLMVNASNGQLVSTQHFSVDGNGDVHGGVKSAPLTRTNPFGNASSVSPVLAWDAPPPTATGVDRSEKSLSTTFVLVTSSSHSSVDKMVCSYTLNSHGGITSSMLTIDGEGSLNSSITWAPNIANSVLYSPYTQSFCGMAMADPDQTQVIIVPAITTLILVQKDYYNETAAFSRVSANPMREAIAATTGYSYGLRQPFDEVVGTISALNPVGSSMTFICAYDTVYAYDSVISNETWSLTLTELPYCQANSCLCPTDNSLLTISTDRKYLFVTVTVHLNQSNFNVPPNISTPGLLAVDAVTGLPIDFIYPDTFMSLTQCTEAPPISSYVTPYSFGPITELSMTANDEFVGVSIMPGSRCLVLWAVYWMNFESKQETANDNMPFMNSKPMPLAANRSMPTSNYSILTFSAYPFYFQGTWASFGADIDIQGDYLIVKDTRSQSSIWSMGASAYFFSLAQLYSQTQLPGLPLNGMLPIYAISNVLDVVGNSDTLFVVTSQRSSDVSGVAIILSAYELSPNINNDASQITVAQYSGSGPALQTNLSKIRAFLLPRILLPVICVAASNLSCFTASGAFDHPVSLPANGSTEYYGKPAVSDIGLMIFTQEGAPCNAVMYGEIDEVPIVFWSEPSWIGKGNGVDMNINASSCDDAVITYEGILLVCLSNTQVGKPIDLSKHMYLLEGATGKVLLAFGPTARTGTSTFSDSGYLITYVNTYNTAITLQLTGESVVEPVTIRSSFCLTDIDNLNGDNYASFYLEFSSDFDSVVAVRTPYNLSQALSSVQLSPSISALPLRAKQFRGFLGIGLGSSFYLEGSAELINLLGDSLPITLQQQGTFNFLRGEVTSITNSDYSTSFVTSGSCQACVQGYCPSFCTIELATGNQFMYEMVPGTNYFELYNKPFGETEFEDSGVNLPVPFTGNASLVVLRQEFALAEQLQSFQCNDEILGSETKLASTAGARYCMPVPRLDGKQYVSIEIAANASFATVTSYFVLWGAEYYVCQQEIQTTTVWKVTSIPSLTNLINAAIGSGTFPNNLPSGALMPSVGSISLDPYADGLLISASADGSDPFTLTNFQCSDMDAQIEVCPSTLLIFDLNTQVSSASSIVWRGVEGSNWGTGFVATNFPVHLPDIMRFPTKGKPVQCGGESSTCPSICQPLANCNSQTISFLNHYLYTCTMLPTGSEAVIPAVFLASCGQSIPFNTTGSESTVAGLPGYSGAGTSLATRFYCSHNGEVVMTTELSGQEVVVGVFASNSTNYFAGAQLSCSDCTFFMLFGVIPQPIEWIAAGAVKSLVITVLFYFILDKIRKNHRFQTRSKNRHKHHSKKLQALELRLNEHRMFMNRAARNSQESMSPSAVLLTALDAPVTAISESSSPITLITERAMLFHGYRSQPIESMSDEERRVERRLLLSEVERVKEQVQDDEAYEAMIERSRWFCAKVLPNPISLYSKVVLKLSGIRHPEERRAMLVRVQDGLSSKDVSSWQLIDMLMNITGESPSERHVVENFSHFYQWNMCLNRQVVIREYIEESAHFGAPGVLELLDQSLQKAHDHLRETYVLFRLAFVDRHCKSRGNDADEVRSTAVALPDQDCSADFGNTTPSMEPDRQPDGCPEKTPLLPRTSFSAAAAFNPYFGIYPPLAGADKSCGTPRYASMPGTPPLVGSPPIYKPSKSLLEARGEEILRTARHMYDGPEEGPQAQTLRRSNARRGSTLGGSKDAVPASARGAATFKGMDGVATTSPPLMPQPSSTNTRKSQADSTRRATKQHSNLRSEEDASSMVTTANSQSNLGLGAPLTSASLQVQEDEEKENDDSLMGFIDVDISNINAAEWEHYKYTVAAEQLKAEVDAFVGLIHVYPQCFEYAALPSRSIDDKLMPNTLLIIASIFQCLVIMVVYAIDVIRRSSGREEGQFSAFDVYQCVFFMVFNSSAPSALLVSVMARADLGSLEHSQTIRTKVHDIFTDPYVVFILLLYSFPLVTHILPGMFLYGWLTIPAIVLGIWIEYLLRTRLSLQTRFVIAVRFFSRVIILFTGAMVLTMSYNYSASYIWSTPKGYLMSGSYRQTSYFQVVVDDFWARNLSCFYVHITTTVSNFLQMGFTSLY